MNLTLTLVETEYVFVLEKQGQMILCRGFTTEQKAFNYIADNFPGYPVIVDIS